MLERTPPRSAEAVPLALRLYGRLMDLLAPAAPLLLAWRARHGKEDPARRGERLGEPGTKRPKGPLVWFHAASVGEANALVPLIESLGERRPDLALLLTTGTVTSARLAEKRLGKSVIHQYVPLDAPRFIDRFLTHWRPALGVFAESEIWPSLVLEAAAKGVPLALVNGRLSERTHRRWRRTPRIASALFSRFELVLAQNERHAARFAALGAGDARAAGNLKIDAPPPPAGRAALAELKNRTAGRLLFLAASTHAGEEDIAAEVHVLLKRRHPRLLTIIVPRHPGRAAALAGHLRNRNLTLARRSRGETIEPDTDIYLADTIGELGVFYALSPVAFIGGSLIPHGGQNPVEAVGHGAAVLTGPHYRNFRDVYDRLAAAGGCAVVADAKALAKQAGGLLADDKARAAMHKRAVKALQSMSGALALTLDVLETSLPPRKGRSRAA